ncbi:Uncharacterised protein [uncultured archaeon]|nr:Uncharacterised protein [uncultured archaeon]
MSGVFFEFVGPVISLNFPWLVDFFLSNLLWLFILSVMVHILFNGQKFVPALAIFTFALWLWGDFETLSGIGFAGAQVLFIYYMAKISLLSIVESTPSLRPHLLAISTISGCAALIVANVFM